MRLIKKGTKLYQRLVNRSYFINRRVRKSVKNIIEDVRLYGDEAVLKYTRRFDKVKLKAKDLRVTESELVGAYQDIKPEIVNTLKLVMENINRFYKKNIPKSWRTKSKDGIMLGEKVEPIESVGIYIPSGTVPLVSSVYMTAMPAKIAGVKRIVLVSPPNKYGAIDPYILVVANLLKVDEIYKAGGAQAIAALAFGTKTIPKVAKIVGPGNAYVTEAKRQVFGYCDIDMLAGPSEVLIIANNHANAEYIKKDLAAQSEHYMGLSILVTISKKLAMTMKKEIAEGYVVPAKNLDEAIEIANDIAPEHLEIMVNNWRRVLKGVKNAGAIFIGPYTPVAVGDYVAGPSHVLPTGGTSRFFSGLGVSDFVKSSHVISYSKKALEEIREEIEKLASIEGLPRHMDSVKARFE